MGLGGFKAISVLLQFCTGKVLHVLLCSLLFVLGVVMRVLHGVVFKAAIYLCCGDLKAFYV